MDARCVSFVLVVCALAWVPPASAEDRGVEIGVGWSALRSAYGSVTVPVKPAIGLEIGMAVNPIVNQLEGVYMGLRVALGVSVPVGRFATRH